MQPADINISLKVTQEQYDLIKAAALLDFNSISDYLRYLLSQEFGDKMNVNGRGHRISEPTPRLPK